MLVNFNFLLKNAIKNDYAVGIAEVWDLNTIKASIEAAIEERSPFGILSCQHYIEEIGLEQFRDIAISYINATDIPIALCLDECNDLNFIFNCIKAGFTFVMFDGAGSDEAGNGKKLSYEENIVLTKKVVEVAHATGVTVEASLGEMPMAAKGGLTSRLEHEGKNTDPDQALDYVTKTNIDILAPSIGNIHCAYGEKMPDPDWELARKISEKINIPLSLHGGSGASDEQIRKAISVGFKKINMGTRYDDIYRRTLMEELNKCEGWGCSFDSVNDAADKVKNEIKRLMREVYKSSYRIESNKDRYSYMTTESAKLKNDTNYQTFNNSTVEEITRRIVDEIRNNN